MVVFRAEWRAAPATVAANIAKRLGFPLFVKPANLGSSVGISKVHGPGELAAALELAASFDRKIVVEAAVPDAREIEVGVVGNASPEASVPGEIVPSREFYDYEAKYLDAGSRTEIPARLDDEMAREVRRQAVAAFLAIDGAGFARVDFLLSRTTGELFINEINTIPGFTTISMFSKMWGASGLDYPALVDRLIALALERHAEKQESKTTAF
jgi:D-alanine-D-alanine ligase